MQTMLFDMTLILKHYKNVEHNYARWKKTFQNDMKYIFTFKIVKKKRCMTWSKIQFSSMLGRHLMSIVKSVFEARPKVVEAEPRVRYELQMSCNLHCNWYIYFLSNKCLPGVVWQFTLYQQGSCWGNQPSTFSLESYESCSTRCRGPPEKPYLSP